MVEFLKEIFLYSNKSPLNFTSLYFWVFFAIVFLVYTLFCKNNFIRSLYLLIVSLFFYYKTSGLFFIILIISTIINYFTGEWIYRSNKKTNKTIFLAISVTINLLILSYFKYSYFAADTINHIFGTKITIHDYLLELTNNISGSKFDASRILLPAGISFYMFQTMSYTIDIYKDKLTPIKNIIDFGFFVSFFPQLVAGPILRASEFIPQIYKKYEISKYDFGLAIFIILRGLIKKIVFADYIAVNFVDRVFTNPSMYSGFESLMATIAYSLQVYMDFSAYSDIAIGIALLMGFRIPENFRSPYKAKNCGEFWKRWHISLSTWLKDYLYIPLGGNKNFSHGSYINICLLFVIFGLMAKNVLIIAMLLLILLILFIIARYVPQSRKTIASNTNLMITMLLGGLWHGSNWNFIIWGGLNGIGIVIYKFWKKISPYENINKYWANILKIAITFTFITFTRIFFRAENLEKANSIMKQIWNNFNFSIIPNIILAYWKVWVILVIGFVLHWLSDTFKNNLRNKFINSPIWLKGIVVIIVVFAIYQAICSDMQAFIYFQF